MRYGGGRSYYGRGASKNVRWSMKDVFNDGYEPKIFQTIEDYRAWKKSGSKMEKGGFITFSDGYKFQEVSKSFAEKNWDKMEIYGINISEESEGLIDSKNDIEDYDNFGIEHEDYAKGGEVKKKENNEMLIGGIAGILIGIFLGRR